jgi:hypothetical protein
VALRASRPSLRLPVLGLLFAAVFIALIGFFVAAEFAFV